MRRVLIVAVGVVGILSMAVGAWPALAATAPPAAQKVARNAISGPRIGAAIKPGVMAKSLRSLPPPLVDQGGKHGLPMLTPGWFPRPRRAPLVVQAAPQGLAPAIGVHALAPAEGQNFNGVGGDDPPDDNAAVGPLYVLQTTNFSIGFYDKGTGNLVSGTSLGAFFSAGSTGTPCDNSGAQVGDPVALYDKAADRYIISNLATTSFVNGPWEECIAISRTSDPIGGGWWFYAIPSGAAGGGQPANKWLPDYPKIGVWPDGYYMMADLFDINPNPTPPPTNTESFQTVRVWALNRTAMLSGGAITPISFDVGGGVFSMVPTNWTGGTAPPAGRVNYFGVTDYPDPSQGQSSTTIHIYKFHADFVTPVNSTFTGPANVTVPTYTSPATAPPQPGTDNLLDTLGTRLMYQFQYRNIGGTESLWGVHTVNGASDFCVTRWYQFDVTGDPATPTLVQSGTTANGDSTHRWMGHVATDQFGNMALEYSDSSSSVNPGVRYNGRLFGDGTGTLGSEATLFTGPGVFQDCTPDTAHGQTTCVARWGDYSSMQVDPVDDCTFWLTNEYATAGHAAVTRIGSARFGGCTCDVQITKTHSPSTVLANGVLTWTLHVSNSGPVGAYAVSVSDTITNPLAASVVAPSGWSCTDPGVGNTGAVTCTGVFANGGAVDIAINVTAPNSITTLSNSGSVTTGSTNTASLADTTATDAANVLSPSDVTGTKTLLTPSWKLLPNYAIEYQVVLTNNSDYDQFDNPGDEFTDTLPATLTLTGAAATSGTVTTGANTVHWNGAIPAHASVIITIDATILSSVTYGSTITNTGTIYYDVNGDGTNSGQRTVSVAFNVTRPIPTLSILGLAMLLAVLVGLGVFLLARRH
jgi:uncharacterized repeat protein (TIGR01451 family)